MIILGLQIIFEDSLNLQYRITSEQLKKELQNFYSQFQSELLVNFFCGRQGISSGSPFSPPSEIRSIAKSLLKRLFASTSQHASQSCGSLYYPFMDKQSKNVTNWWNVCSPEVIGMFHVVLLIYIN